MNYAHVTDGVVDYRGSLPKNWKNISGLSLSADDLPFLKSIGWLPYIEVTVSLGVNEVIDGEDIVVGSDKVTSTQTKRSMTDAEISSRLAVHWENLRSQRNELLTETDWMASSDRTISNAEKAYRQALRDLPANTADPSDVTWPTAP